MQLLKADLGLCFKSKELHAPVFWTGLSFPTHCKRGDQGPTQAAGVMWGGLVSPRGVS